MTLSFLRDAITKRLQDKVDAAGARAINMRVHTAATADGYALVQVDTLAEARAFAEAVKIVIEEYKRLVEQTVAETPGEVPQGTKKETSIYG
jgi:stage V sporulation protein SpoVS